MADDQYQRDLAEKIAKIEKQIALGVTPDGIKFGWTEVLKLENQKGQLIVDDEALTPGQRKIAEQKAILDDAAKSQSKLINPEEKQISQDFIDKLFTVRAFKSARELAKLNDTDRGLGQEKGDGNLTLDEYREAMAYRQAYEDLMNHVKPGTSFTGREIAEKAKALMKDEEFLTKVTKEFRTLEREFPDNRPFDGTISLPEAAEKERDFLNRTFPDEVRRMNQSNELGTAKSAYDIINNKALEKEPERE